MAVCATPPRPVRLLSFVLTGALAWAAAGCTGGDPPAGPASPPLSASPAADQAGTPAALPEDAQEYAEAAVAAWASADLIRLAELTTAEVHERIVELPGPPDLRWRSATCLTGPEPDASPDPSPGPAGAADPGTSACTFHNTDGDELVLTVAHELLGGPRAVVAMAFEATTYPEEAQAYVDAFIRAWRDGNQPRMDRLALPDVTAEFAELPPPAEVDYRSGGTEDRLATVLVELTPAPPELAPEDETEAGAAIDVEARLSTALLGQPQAIRQVSVSART